MRKHLGWIYRDKAETAGMRDHLVVTVNPENGSPVRKDFPDSAGGASNAAEFITEVLGRDDWRLEECGFLGMRIVVPVLSDPRGTNSGDK